MKEDILNIKDLKVYFPIKGELIPRNVAYVKAVDGISLNIKQGETLGLVGESGCGKSTTGRAILRLVESKEGEIFFNGKDVLKMSKKDLKSIRKDAQMIFQDPFASLNPRMTVIKTLEEVLYVHKYGDKLERGKRAEELVEMVGLSKKYLDRYPHEFSGGQRQRIVIARALAVDPKFIICDEAVSALDVSVQSQVLNLLEDLQKNLNLTYLFISHDLSVVKHISDKIAVMYLGKIVEIAKSDGLFKKPSHPYTKALLSSVPIYNPDIKREIILLEGDIPSPINPPSGCRFNTRCPFVEDICIEKEPLLRKIGEDHTVACHFNL